MHLGPTALNVAPGHSPGWYQHPLVASVTLRPHVGASRGRHALPPMAECRVTWSGLDCFCVSVLVGAGGARGGGWRRAGRGCTAGGRQRGARRGAVPRRLPQAAVHLHWCAQPSSEAGGGGCDKEGGEGSAAWVERLRGQEGATPDPWVEPEHALYFMCTRVQATAWRWPLRWSWCGAAAATACPSPSGR
jgi:hypothetical protein